ncbi:MAG: copper resistance protein CopC [Gammaproteobacteria bacterium]|nr:MAG: copper resistance protein CopC [Gammaproteobacteria bacterium]
MQNKRSMFTTKKITIFASLLIIFSLAFEVKVAMAHASLVKSDPPRRATLSMPPKQIKLWFNEKIEGSYASVTVRDSNKNSITENTPESVADDPKSVVLSLPQIEPGRYTVHYRVMSVDGHVIESSFDFSVKNKM